MIFFIYRYFRNARNETEHNRFEEPFNIKIVNNKVRQWMQMDNTQYNEICHS